jgi:drug/metabolite transporter (DMT)-like permease
VTLHRILKLDDGCSPFDGITTIIQALILLCGLFTAFRLINRRVDPTNMYWSAGALVVLGLLIMSGTVYAMFLWDRILESGDATKLVIGAIVNPLLFEILLFMARVIVRMVPHCTWLRIDRLELG